MNMVKVGGGGAKSRLWLQILADITTNNLYSSQCVESGALGVAILASVGSGYYNSINEASGKMTACDLTVTEFNAEKIDYYNSIYKIYKSLYCAIKSAQE